MPSIRTILVPVDFSELSCFAVREAASIADKFGAGLLLLHVAEPSQLDGYEGGEALGENEAYEAEELARLAQAEAPDANAEFAVMDGEVGEVIRRLCEERPIDLIVMPTRGSGSYRRFLLGSNTAKALHDAACPVLTGAHLEHPEQACYPYQRIGCLLDLKGDSPRVLARAHEFAKAHEAELAAIHMAPPFRLEPSQHADFAEVVESSARRRLERLVEEEGAEAEIIVQTGGLEKCLPQLLERRSFDLLVISRRSAAADEDDRGLSSEAYAVIRSAPCPVLSV